ncbi:hypothetical protein KDA_32710 [Dictyobacter alpinus]|uniref:Uncharacterized protein n=1 Tax=Dictyobacter alpinus TaxID=2014873 RepID=A0A402B8Y9_9CHLR|nr:hypothetical protein [Dictyobacter alpinus]GCE27787.1 hypothetical protein KDA_32710 [Dictyobacter alpinus]
MPNTTTTAENILNRLKGLRAQMQPGEEPVLALPAIWDGGQSSHSTPCDVIITNQRLLGFYYKSFPRERIFVDALNLADLRTVTWRDKNHEPVFREIQVKDDKRSIYIRTPRQKSESLYAALQAAVGTTYKTIPTPGETEPTIETTVDQPDSTSTGQLQSSAEESGPVFNREEVRRPFENTSLAAVLLMVGGIILEIISLSVLFTTHNTSVSTPLFIAGFVAVAGSFMARRSPK